MSAEQSRLRSAIQRLAKSDAEISNAIKATSNRGDQPGASGVGTSDSERDRICCDGSTSNNRNPGASTRDTSEGGQSGLDPSDPANLDGAGPGELTGVVDCSTGTPVCIEGGEFAPSPDAADCDESFMEGYYYEATARYFFAFNETVKFGSPTWSGIKQIVDAEIQRVKDQLDSDGCGTIRTGSNTETRYSKTLGNAAGTNACMNMSADRVPVECNDSGEDYCAVTQEDVCPSTWPEDGCVNLAIKGGAIVGSKYDPENDGSYSAPRDEIELCDPETGDSILIRPSSSGGWKSIQSLAGDIDPDTGAGYLYRPNGQRIRQISPSEFRDDTV